MTRVHLSLSDNTRVTRQDGLLDVIEIADGQTVVTLTVGPSGAAAAARAGGEMLAAARRQEIPETTAMGGTKG